ncbi:MAG TPA: ABC-F family ATP-binding cassette domain-containing protein [Rhizomicrobium sp.]|jgi:ATP-binding cassette subfamily F protein 3|nr:ABC-F family ATP-binding cassette domain-containing protein [Rhizomicrobium sp.]
MLSIEDVTYRIAGREILSGASARLPAGGRTGLVGRNGAGKSTLLRLILGELAPDAGDIARPSSWRVGAVAQEAPGGDETLLDTVLAADAERLRLLLEGESESDAGRLGEVHGRLEAIDAYSAPARAAAILAGLGFSTAEQNRPCREFSGGWRMRVALAGILFSAPDLLLLDEPTNYLDLEGILWLEDYLRRYRGTVIIVSHDRDLLDATAEFILHLERGRLTLYSGNYETFVETREARRALDAATAKKQETTRQYMQAFVDRFRYKQSKARQAQSRLKMLARLKPAEIPLDEHVAPIRLPRVSPATPPLLSLESTTVGYDRQRPVLARISLRIDPDERVALLGKNGNGKSTFAKLLAGKLQPFSGTVARAPDALAGYFAQHQLEELDGSLTPLDTLGHMRPRLSERELRTQLGGFGLAGDKALTKVVELSGGERARLMLALATLDAPNLLILDEPTNHLDIDAREQLLAALNDYAGAVVLVSHDRRLIEATVDRLLLVAAGTVSGFEGDLEDYRRQVLAPDAETRESRKPENKRDLRRDAAARRTQLKPLREKASAAEAEIAELTQTIADLDAALSASDVFSSNAVKAAELARRRARAARALAEAESRWVAATQAYEDALAEQSF